ncbi:MAG: uroporphyrinogen-III C-methyltransferase [Luteitalea sp.]|nr:uroporphyrinogen-III C-methyltransferase [Luteitalea sp.]
MRGCVFLVGAGPGDPELLTRKAARCLQEADLVLYDALVSPEALALAPRAQRFQVGKRAGRPSIQQGTINELMIRAARQGKRVVRLKCGDPFVLGRGGEEAVALRAAGIPVEVVPGVTSASAAPALAGIPVTHRGYASGVLLVSGHDPEVYGELLGAAPPQHVTIVVLMGIQHRDDIARRLMAHGWAPTSPAAIVFGASTSSESTWTGTLGEIGNAALPPGDLPGTIIVGEVVRLRALIHTVEAEEGSDYEGFACRE